MPNLPPNFNLKDWEVSIYRDQNFVRLFVTHKLTGCKSRTIRIDEELTWGQSGNSLLAVHARNLINELHPTLGKPKFSLTDPYKQAYDNAQRLKELDRINAKPTTPHKPLTAPKPKSRKFNLD